MSLSELLERSAASYAPRASAAGATITVKAADEVVSLDPVRMRQAVENLLDNALRYSGNGASIEVAGERVDGSIRVSVRDSGDGFPPELLDRVLQPFVRGREGDGAGAGLGLAIVDAVAEAHRGDVRAENDARGGARITMTIPG